MATEIKLPRLGQGMESGTIVKWLKSEGEPVEKGEPLYELDTDKVTQEVEADASGVLLRIAVQEGEVDGGHTIAVIGNEGEEVPEPKQEAPAEPEPKPKQEAPAPETLQQTVARTDGRDGGRIKASPPARRIARRMTEAWQAPAFQISMSADMTRALAIRARLVERGDTPKPTVSDLLTKVAAAALMRHREVNALFDGDAVRLMPTADIGIAVATERGLVVPVIRGCERLTIPEIAAARADLVERARSGKLQQGDIEGGSFTISNLGMYGVEQFVAVLNPPQAAILAVGAATETPVARDGAVEVRRLMTMTLTCDHRSIDGATAADFLRTVKTFLEEPGLAL